MGYTSASFINSHHAMAGPIGVQKPKRRRKYVPHHMRSEESALKRNARERRRQCRINDALDRLNLHLPQTGSRDRKAGKEGIIRRAVEYIETLSSILGQTSRKLPLFPVHGNPVEIPEPSPEFEPLPAELFGQLMSEAQHWISSTQVTPPMTSSPTNVSAQVTQPFYSEYIYSDLSPCTTQAPNVHCRSSAEESGYFDCSYVDTGSPSSSSRSSVADDIVNELFTSDSFASDLSNEHLESILDFDIWIWFWYPGGTILFAIFMRKMAGTGVIRLCWIVCTFHQFVCFKITWMYINISHHYHYCWCFPSHTHHYHLVYFQIWNMMSCSWF